MGPTNAPALLVFHADGSYPEVDANGDTGIGSWEATGAGTAGPTFRYVFADAAGALAGPATVRATVEATVDGQSFTAASALQLAGPDGTGTGQFGPGRATGTRIAVEPMGTPIAPLTDLFEQGGTPAPWWAARRRRGHCRAPRPTVSGTGATSRWTAAVAPGKERGWTGSGSTS